ncbi:CRNN protein, partial [Alectura lathami]|nr:CRNN protein [Alectura lathami]
MARLQDNINGIIAAFYTYATGDGDSSTLSRGELRLIIEQEFVDVIMDPHDPSAVEKVLRFLDEDSNGKVDFSEFLSVVSHVAKACYRQLQQDQAPEGDQELAVQEEAGGERPHKQVHEQGLSKHVQVGGTSRRDQDTQEDQEDVTPRQDQDTQQHQEGRTPRQDHYTQQDQESETAKVDQDTYQEDRTEAPEEGPKRGETVVTEIPERYGNTQKAEKTPKQDPKPHQDQEIETPKLGLNHHQSPEVEPMKQSPNSPPKTPERDTNKTKDCEAPRQDPNEAQGLPPPVLGTRPRPDPSPRGTQQDQAPLPAPKVEVQVGSVAEAQPAPGQGQEGAHGKGQHAAEQKHLQPQWPLQK